MCLVWPASNKTVLKMSDRMVLQEGMPGQALEQAQACLQSRRRVKNMIYTEDSSKDNMGMNAVIRESRQVENNADNKHRPHHQSLFGKRAHTDLTR